MQKMHEGAGVATSISNCLDLFKDVSLLRASFVGALGWRHDHYSGFTFSCGKVWGWSLLVFLASSIASFEYWKPGVGRFAAPLQTSLYEFV